MHLLSKSTSAAARELRSCRLGLEREILVKLLKTVKLPDVDLELITKQELHLETSAFYLTAWKVLDSENKV